MYSCRVSAPSTRHAHAAGVAAYHAHRRTTAIGGGGATRVGGASVETEEDDAREDEMLHAASYQMAYSEVLANSVETDVVGVHDYWSGELLFSFSGQHLYDLVVVPSTPLSCRVWMSDVPAVGGAPDEFERCSPQAQRWITEMVSSVRVVLATDTGVHVYDLARCEYVRSMDTTRLITAQHDDDGPRGAAVGEYIDTVRGGVVLKKLIPDVIAPVRVAHRLRSILLETDLRPCCRHGDRVNSCLGLRTGRYTA